MEQARRVKGRGPVTATCRITADRKLGVGGSGPLRGPPPDSTQRGSARGGRRAQLGQPAPSVRVPLAAARAPRRAPGRGPAARCAQRLPRAAAAPAAQRQSPSQGSHGRAPPAPPPAAAALPMIFARLPSAVPRPRPEPGSRASGSRGSGASDSAHGRSLQQRGRAPRGAAGWTPRGGARPHGLAGGATAGAAAAARAAGPARRRVRDYRAEERVRIANETPAAAASPPSEPQPMSPRGAGRRAGRRPGPAGGAGGPEAQVRPGDGARPRACPRCANPSRSRGAAARAGPARREQREPPAAGGAGRSPTRKDAPAAAAGPRSLLPRNLCSAQL